MKYSKNAESKIRRYLLASRFGWFFFLPLRLVFLLRYHAAQIKPGLLWLWRSREFTNFTYSSPPHAQWGLAGHASAVAGISLAQAWAYGQELLNDVKLANYIAAQHAGSERRGITNAAFKPGPRLLNYMLVRALKPRLVVEAGVENGLGAIILCAALARNAQEGFPGRFIGIEGNPGQSCALFYQYPERQGEILRGDAAEILAGLTNKIDLYCHETGPDRADTERQLAALAPLLSERGVVQTISRQMAFVHFAQKRGLRLLMGQDFALDLFRPHGSHITTLFPAPPP